MTVFYAGHGGMVSNQQVLILNGEEIPKKKVRGEPAPEPGETEWDYIYRIEQWLKSRFNFGDYCFTFSVFDCCRSIVKERQALTERQVE